MSRSPNIIVKMARERKRGGRGGGRLGKMDSDEEKENH